MERAGFNLARTPAFPVTDEYDAFDRALRRLADGLDVEPEQGEDRAFLHELAVRSSPLSCVLPRAVLEQQAAAQEASHVAEHPGAMRRIISVEGTRAGRIAIDWGAGKVSHGVDIAVLPEFRRRGVGLSILKAWLEVADRGGWHCTFYVNRENPAVRLYERVGFRFSDEKAIDPASPFLRMVRSPPAIVRAARKR